MGKTKVSSLIRLVKYMFKKYKFHTFAIFIFILLSTYCMVRGTMLIQVLIDKFIIPNINNKIVDFQPLKEIIKIMILTYLTGIICTLIYQQIIIRMAQGTLKNLRDDVFEHMEGLPIKYFDTHAHGDIMSVYSSDIDVNRKFTTSNFSFIYDCWCYYFNDNIKFTSYNFSIIYDNDYIIYNKIFIN